MEAPCCSRCADDADGESQPFGATLADGGCSPFEYAAQEELHERVEACLRQVPEAFRTVVVLREIEGFTYEEIADVLQVNLGTVKSRLTRGRAALRELLASEKSNLACAHVAAAHRASAPAPVCACLDATAAEQKSSPASRNRPRAHAGCALDSRAGSRLEASR
jgi:hypothetical protein